jgi:hypothetical protein
MKSTDIERRNRELKDLRKKVNYLRSEQPEKIEVLGIISMPFMNYFSLMRKRSITLK